MTKMRSLVEPGFQPPEGLEMVVAGMPRGATTFTANVFNQVIPTGHESIFRNRHLQNPPAGRTPKVEVSGFAAPWAQLLKAHGVIVVQLLRHPLYCCTSYFNYFSAGKDRKDKATWEEACETYYEFHRELRAWAAISIQAEKWEEEFPIALSLLGINSPKLYDPKGAKASWSEPRREWDELPDKLKEDAAIYGYSRP